MLKFAGALSVVITLVVVDPALASGGDELRGKLEAIVREYDPELKAAREMSKSGRSRRRLGIFCSNIRCD